MTYVNSPITGLEQIQRAAWFVLIDTLNDQIAALESFMAPSDEAVATRKGEAYTPTTIERIAQQNFYEGHRPSLINAPIDRYPNCAVWCVRAVPAGGAESLDQGTAYRDVMYVEVMVKSSASEEEVNRRVHRTADAVNICLMRNQTLNGVVHGLDVSPTVNISDVFTRKETTAYGPEWFWQGARLEYAVRKEAVNPSSTPGSVFRTSQYDYDQA